MDDKVRSTDEIDEELSNQVKENTNIRKFTVTLEEAIQTTCGEICRQKYPPNAEPRGKTVPWWTETLKLMRKRTIAMRRRYKRATSNEELRENRKNQYTKAKKVYQATIKTEKIRSWKQYCTTTLPKQYCTTTSPNNTARLPYQTILHDYLTKQYCMTTSPNNTA